MQAGLRGGRGVPPHLAGESLGAVAALEDLQAVGALLAELGAHLALPKHRLADLGPEVACAAEALGAVGRAQAGVALVAWWGEIDPYEYTCSICTGLYVYVICMCE